VLDRMDDLKVDIEDGNRLSLEKMQKGKDDAWILSFGPYEEGDYVPPEGPEDGPEDEGEYCDVWEGKDFTGVERRFKVTSPTDWRDDALASLVPLGSWKCTDNTKVWF